MPNYPLNSRLGAVNLESRRVEGALETRSVYYDMKGLVIGQTEWVEMWAPFQKVLDKGAAIDDILPRTG